MASFALRLSAPGEVSSVVASQSFYWLKDTKRSSFTTGLQPGLGSLGPVLGLNIDLVRIAVAVFAADRSVVRAGGGSDWNARSFEILVPVSDPAIWKSVTDELASLIGFLTGDHWRFEFSSESAPPEEIAAKTDTLSRVVLLSGGADSAAGAVVSKARLADTEGHGLVSHFSARTLAPLQRNIAERVNALGPERTQRHYQFHVSRNQKQLDGDNYPSESSSRSRSLLFLALGLAVASLDRVPLWIPENGFASLNPPLGPDRRGSLSTHTTHPAFLQGLSAILARIGAHGEIENPFAEKTKGEMFDQLGQLLGGEASKLLSATTSCAHTGQRNFGVSSTMACGVCFGCVVRRAAFHASGIPDQTPYIDPSGNEGLKAWLDDKSVVPAIRSLVARGVNPRDLVAMSLPDGLPLSRAREICERSLAELGGFVS